MTLSLNSTRGMTGRAALAEMLNIGSIFGMGGFQLLPFYEACRVLG
jgi:acetolactate synthase-1/2/3 large subunit